MRSMYRVLAVAIAGCAAGTASPSGKVISNAVPHARSGALFDIDVDALGPITGATPATTEALQALLGSRYIVTTVDNHGEELNVFLGDERLFYVIPNDDGTLFNVHVVSPKVAIGEYPEWVIGSPFHNTEPLTSCECWGSHPVCYHRGDHVAVAFQVACGGLETPAQRKALEGVVIQRAVWSPHAFGGPDESMTPRSPSAEPPNLSRMFEGGTP